MLRQISRACLIELVEQVGINQLAGGMNGPGRPLKRTHTLYKAGARGKVARKLQIVARGWPGRPSWAGGCARGALRRGSWTRRGDGCPKCRHTGYYGRAGVFEVLTLNKRLRQLISEGATPDVLARVARQDGLRSLREHAIRKVADGVTALEEALHTTSDIEGGT